MRPDQFRRLALTLPEALEGEHNGHADFRVGGKVFASLGPDEQWAMVRLTPEGQAARVAAEPHVFQPFNGAWGRQGCTKLVLALAAQSAAHAALREAWRRTAPPRLVAQHDDAHD